MWNTHLIRFSRLRGSKSSDLRILPICKRELIKETGEKPYRESRVETVSRVVRVCRVSIFSRAKRDSRLSLSMSLAFPLRSTLFD